MGMVRIYSLTLILLLSLFLPWNKGEANVFHLSATRVDIKSKLLGQWRVVSKVVWSDCDYVKEGLESESEIVFQNLNGRLFPEWRASEWKLVRNSTIDFSYDDSLHWERESKLEKAGDYWFVRTINDFNFDERGRLIGTSHVKQYLNGEFVGSYVTESHLEPVRTS